MPARVDGERSGTLSSADSTNLVQKASLALQLEDIDIIGSVIGDKHEPARRVHHHRMLSLPNGGPPGFGHYLTLFIELKTHQLRLVIRNQGESAPRIYGAAPGIELK